ncbi:MAG: TolC family protein [Gemmataceae bacterium]|nr:TolC family protein [Gemmataceae bacterium]MDW8242396.1 TolC family protein [Thermogemmata sp.]
MALGLVLTGSSISLCSGCALQSPLPEGAFVRKSVLVPRLPPPQPPAALPVPPAPLPSPSSSKGPDWPEAPPPRPADPEGGQPPAIPSSPLPDNRSAPLPLPRPLQQPLRLDEVLDSVAAAFPLLLAIELERTIAAGQRLAAEGQFDPVLRLRSAEQTGTFASSRLAATLEQNSPYGGISTFAGWRWGVGNFPIYYNDRKTGEGGELQAGVVVPLLQNREIDPRRARLRIAQIGQNLAEPTIRSARLDFFRNAAQAYWGWQVAGAQYRIAEDLLRLAVDRQQIFDVQFREGKIAEAPVALNRRLVASRREALLAAERLLQQAALRLSLFLRDETGQPVVPPAEWLDPDFLNTPLLAPQAAGLAADVQLALQQRPELARFQLEKQRRAVEWQLANNQLLPALNLTVQGAQDMGIAKKTLTGTGPFATDRTTGEVGATLEFPLPFRNARGQLLTAQAQLAQLLAQERYARDEITVQVQDAVSELLLTYQRLQQAREELRQAERVLQIETVRFQEGRISLVELNLQEIAAAEAKTKVAVILGSYFNAVAQYLTVLGFDRLRPTAPTAVLPMAR